MDMGEGNGMFPQNCQKIYQICNFCNTQLIVRLVTQYLWVVRSFNEHKTISKLIT